MKTSSIISKLEKQGYKVTYCFSGKVIASKGQRTYIAESYNSLHSQIFTEHIFFYKTINNLKNEDYEKVHTETIEKSGSNRRGH